ncbi:hypothetical protein LQ953_10065 [Sphingomonas sp. IC-56]|uniref:hypothetical protein n=1 Tax=Sphingomonas sp. IC-56 TaxID=2898529 RepID=UPI001E4BA313|nr:hypothetical protein [Sphingomonas sp. IC-56]MCD2324356.1 hypothetical protein [Sphingomonas sp. IC-56]
MDRNASCPSTEKRMRTGLIIDLVKSEESRRLGIETKDRFTYRNCFGRRTNVGSS